MLFCPFYNSDIVQTFQLHMHAKNILHNDIAYMDLQFIAFMDFECSHVFSVFCCVSKHYRLSCFVACEGMQVTSSVRTCGPPLI